MQGVTSLKKQRSINMRNLESKHRVLQHFSIGICANILDLNWEVLVYHLVQIFNDLHGNGVASAYELAKGITRPEDDYISFLLPDDILNGHEDLIAVWRLNKILKSKSISDKHVKMGDLVQKFGKKSGEKRGLWSSPKLMLDVNLNASPCLSLVQMVILWKPLLRTTGTHYADV